MSDVFTDPLDMEFKDEVPTIDKNEFLKVINSRRSVRVYKPTQIPDAHVHECINAALLAPSSSNLQPWEFYYIKTPEMKSKVVTACLSQPAAKTAPVLIVCVARTDTWRRNRNLMLDLFSTQPNVPKPAVDYYKKLVPFSMIQGPLNSLGFLKKALLFFIGLTKVVPREPTSLNDVKVWAVKSTALACENLMLAFRAFGYDSCPMEGFDSKRLKKTLNLPKKAHVVMVVSAGIRDKKGVYGQQIRFDRNLFVHEV